MGFYFRHWLNMPQTNPGVAAHLFRQLVSKKIKTVNFSGLVSVKHAGAEVDH